MELLRIATAAPLDSSAAAALCVTCILLNAYCAGADTIERFVNYQTWPWIPRAAFARYHRAQTAPIAWTIVVPQVLCVLSQLLLLFAMHDRPLQGIVILMLAASVAGIASTLLLQIPIHRSFSRHGYDVARLRRLLLTDWLRKAVDLLRMLLSVRLLWTLLRPG